MFRHRFALVVLLATGATLSAAQRPADDNAFPHTKPNGRATVEYKDEKVQAVVIYDYSQRNHDTDWLFVQVGVALRERGTEVVLIQPTADDLEQMGPNLMSRRNRNAVIETARLTVAAQLEETVDRELLDALPAGDERRVRRPDGDPSTWPDLNEIRRLSREQLARGAARAD